MSASSYVSQIIKYYEPNHFPLLVKNLNLLNIRKYANQPFPGLPAQIRSDPSIQKIKNLLKYMWELEKFRNDINSLEECFRDPNKNLISHYQTIFDNFARSGEFFANEKLRPLSHIFKNLCIEMKADLQRYWKLKNQKLGKAVEGLINSLRSVFIEYRKSRESSETLLALNQLFWIYFRINQFQQSTHIVKSIMPQLNDLLRTANKDSGVTLLFYLGKMNLFEGNYAEAELYLDRAIQICSAKFTRNFRAILHLLVPTKLIRGKLPNEKLFEKYMMPEYEEIIKCMRLGDLQGYRACKKRHMNLLISRGLYFLIDSLELLLLRNLVRRVWLLEGKPNIIEIDLLHVGINFKNDQPMERFEIQCVIGNLIQRGLIKGYVFPEEDKLVLSKSNAFPKVATVFK